MTGNEYCVPGINSTGYSIENDIVGKTACMRVLSELCGFANVDHKDLDTVCDLFENEFEKFLNAMIPLMAWILCWRRIGKRPNLNDIQMRDIFTFTNGCLQENQKPKGKKNLTQYLHEQCNVLFDHTADISKLKAEFTRSANYRKFTRGKYVFWFLIEFCNAVHRDAVKIFKNIPKAPKKKVTLSCSNGVAVIGARARIPASLRDFLKSNFCAYIEKTAARSCS